MSETAEKIEVDVPRISAITWAKQTWTKLAEKELALKMELKKLQKEKKEIEKELSEQLEGQVLFAWEEE